MNKKISSLLLLMALSITNAYLLAHPNLIGKIGILVYKHSYIRNFPRALLTVLMVVGISLMVCELAYHFMKQRFAVVLYVLFLLVALGFLSYVFVSFSTFSYRLTGKAFIYGAHLLPIILTGLYGRYLVKAVFGKRAAKEESYDNHTDSINQ